MSTVIGEAYGNQGPDQPGPNNPGANNPGANGGHDPGITKFVVPATILLVIALVTYGLRIIARRRTVLRLKWDDHAITIAMLLAILDYALIIAMCAISGGRRIQMLSMSQIEKVMLLGFVSQLAWMWGVTMVKISVSLMMLRIKQQRSWRYGLFGLIGVLVFAVVGNTISILLACRPIEANWKLMLLKKPGVCQTEHTTLILIWTATALFVATDVICSLLPLAFIIKIQRPLREKIVLFTLMALGLIGACFSIKKSVLFVQIGKSPDPIVAGFNISLWAFAELAIGIFAANIPCLKSYLQNAFRALGGHISKMTSGSRTTTGAKTPGDDSKGPHGGSYGDEGNLFKSKTEATDLETWDEKRIVVQHDLESSSVDRTSRDNGNTYCEEANYHKPIRQPSRTR